MNFITQQQFNIYSKTNSDKDIDIDIELPVGITLRSQEQQKKSHHKLLPKFFKSILKSKHNKSNKVNNKKVTLKTAKFEDNTVQYDSVYDTEKTVGSNNFTYLRSKNNETIYDDQCTLHSDDSYDTCKDPFQAFLSRKNIDMIGRNKDTLPVLDINMAEIIRSRLPNLLQEATTWKLLYSMDQHGATLSTVFNRIRGQGPCIMALKSSDGEIFGAFLSEAFDPSKQRFYGTPECFLWKADQYQFKKFKATNLNQYFIFADVDFIAMGGSNGKFGFFLDEDIRYGYSTSCDTFENELLTNKSKFECYGCEFWGLEF